MTRLDLSAGVSSSDLVDPTITVGKQELKIALKYSSGKYYCMETAATYFAVEKYTVSNELAVLALFFGVAIPSELNQIYSEWTDTSYKVTIGGIPFCSLSKTITDAKDDWYITNPSLPELPEGTPNEILD